MTNLALINNGNNYIDKVVGDRKTGLQWIGSPYLEVEHKGDISTITCSQATSWVNLLPRLTPPWRLPTILEMMSLFELNIPLFEATTDSPEQTFWAEGKKPSRPSIWSYLGNRIPNGRFWVSTSERFFTTFSFEYPFRCGMAGGTHVLAVREAPEWQAPDVDRYTPMELIERLGYIKISDSPDRQDMCSGVIYHGSHGEGVMPEAKRTEELLLKMGARAVPALVNASKWTDENPFCRIKDRKYFIIEHGEFSSVIKLRTSLVMEDALRVLDNLLPTLRGKPLLAPAMQQQIDDAMREAEQRRVRRIQSSRRDAYKCILGGHDLSLLDKLFHRQQCRKCTEFME